MRYKHTTFIIISVILAACSTMSDRTPNGLSFTYIVKNESKKAEPGYYVVTDLILKDKKDSVWLSTYSLDEPVFFQIQDSAFLSRESGIQQLIRLLSKGDSIYVEVPAEDLFVKTWNDALPKSINRDDKFSLFLKVINILDRQEMLIWRQDLMRKNEEKISHEVAQQFREDSLKISKYLDSVNLKALTSKEGIRYVIKARGKGFIKSNDLVKINYTVAKLNGDIFDTNIKKIALEKGIYREEKEPYEPLAIIIDQSPFIIGLHLALKELGANGSGSFIIPSTLAYGKAHINKNITPDSILLFEIFVTEVQSN
jgi:FKBP-type peptidyl-prolyl cis-trans isomerase FkpA